MQGSHVQLNPNGAYNKNTQKGFYFLFGNHINCYYYGSFEWGQINQISIAGMLLLNSSFPETAVFFFFSFFPQKRLCRTLGWSSGAQAAGLKSV